MVYVFVDELQEVERRRNREAKLQMIVPLGRCWSVSWDSGLAGDAPSHYAIRNAENRFTTATAEGREDDRSIYCPLRFAFAFETESKIGIGLDSQLLVLDVIGLEIGALSNSIPSPASRDFLAVRVTTRAAATTTNHLISSLSARGNFYY